jgi:hypothetical protein
MRDEMLDLQQRYWGTMGANALVEPNNRNTDREEKVVMIVDCVTL